MTNSGLFQNYGMTVFKNGTGTITRFINDNTTGQDELYGWSNPNGAVANYKTNQSDNGLVPVISAAIGNNRSPFR